MKKRPKPNHDHKPTSEHVIGDEVKVHGAIQVFDTQEAIDQHNAERGEDKTYKNATKIHEDSVRNT